MGLDVMILVFWMLCLSQLFHSPVLPSSRGSLVPFCFLSLGWYHLYIWGYISLPAILIPVCDSSSLAFCMMYSAYKLNKQGDNIQPWCTPFPIWNQFVVPCLVLAIASWPVCRFLRRQVSWSAIPISLRIFHILLCGYIVKGFSIVNEAEIAIFLKFPCFLYDPTDVAVWFLIPLPFTNPKGTSGSSWFKYCWSQVWKILSVTLLACKMSAIVQ